MFRPLLMVSLFSLMALPCLAQNQPPAPAGEERSLARFRMDQLQQTVGLPEEQARTVVERWSRYDREQFELTKQIQQIRHRFNDILLGPGTEEDKNVKVRPLLEQFVELRRQQKELKFRFEDDIRARLSPAQQVRLIIQVEEMQRRVVEALRQGFANRPGVGARRGLR
jgi:Spy/CpxP family protein refolding chaperone